MDGYGRIWKDMEGYGRILKDMEGSFKWQRCGCDWDCLKVEFEAGGWRGGGGGEWGVYFGSGFPSFFGFQVGRWFGNPRLLLAAPLRVTVVRFIAEVPVIKNPKDGQNDERAWLKWIKPLRSKRFQLHLKGQFLESYCVWFWVLYWFMIVQVTFCCCCCCFPGIHWCFEIITFVWLNQVDANQSHCLELSSRKSTQQWFQESF